MFVRQKQKTQDGIAALTKALETIEMKLHYYNEALEHGTLAVYQEQRSQKLSSILSGNQG
ncbi:hypothetical protein BACT_0711 [Bifidobacterium actinocoloniiforme DSM 22766]|uniref:Uncharacterized protein n=1 Tax=Bifidobacterium actinocoloniiforme DSM 22766 TaxID=1437605 RepID=A0A086Z0F9_9BIFI|nr:hypothetical protein [Bifidobacterium actinocoloniiforme]KFI40009.1 hypothetical protein BACT_0711 [Bifidobacterium actinocoloniiforme DSM 22766]